MDKQKFFKEVNKFKSEKIHLQSVNDLLAFTEEADRSFRTFDDLLNDWADKYVALQNEVNSLLNAQEIWQSNTDNLENSMNEFQSKISELGIDAESVPAYGSAERTVSAYREDDQRYNTILDVARSVNQNNI